MLTDNLKKARFLLRTKDILTPWEIRFLSNCLKHPNTLTDKQSSRLKQLIAKYHTHTETSQEPLKRTDTTKTRFSRDEILKGRALRHFPLKKHR